MIKQLPPADELRDLLHYDPKTGSLVWKERTGENFPEAKNPCNAAARWNSQFAGKKAFINKHGRGYLVGKINNVPYYAHRVIWKMVHGTEPQKIDHVSGVTSDNRLVNLRSVDDAGNSRNASRPKNNTSGVVGVYWDDGRQQWRARISDSSRRLHLGNFDTLSDAVEARRQAERTLGYIQNGRRGLHPEAAE